MINNKLIFILIFFITLFFSCVSLKTKEQIAYDYSTLALEYYNLKNYKKAIEFYEKSLSFYGKTDKVVINLIISYQMDKNYKTAYTLIVKYYKKEISDFSKRMLLLLGNNYFYTEDWDKALKAYNLYSETYDTEALGFFNAGLTYQKQGDKLKALEYFLTAYDKDAKFVPALYNISDYYYNEKDYDNALKYLRIVKDMDTSNPEIFDKLSLLEYNFKNYKISSTYIDKAISLDPKNPRYYIQAAKIYAVGFNNKEKTMQNIELALKNDYKDFQTLRTTQEFSILAQYKDYEELLKKYQNTQK